MATKTVDVLIYIQAKDKPEGVSEVVEDVAKISGVVRAQMSRRAKQVLAVEYDPTRISSHSILTVVKEHGYAASLVGL